MRTVKGANVGSAFRRIAVLVALVLGAMLPLAAPAAASDPDQWTRYTDGNGFEVLSWYQCSDSIPNVAVVFLFQDVKDHSGSGDSRKFCLNAGDRGNSYDSFCQDVPGQRWEALPGMCGTPFDDSFNDRTSFVRVDQMSGSAYVKLCQNEYFHAPCMTVNDVTDKDFSSGGKPGPSWNDTISSMRIRQ
jgi:hypothetical protein